MPELPEVETIARTLAPRILGRRILEARFYSSLVAGGAAKELRRRVAGRKIAAVRRHGKFLLLDLDGETLSIHLGMTGRLLWGAVRGPYTRAEFLLDGGLLLYDDVRQFGRIELAGRTAALGPDALAIGESAFVDLLRTRRGRIKPLLLNQGLLCGIGNIYADEALFRARIHPLASAKRLSAARARRLHAAIQASLAAAIASGGSSISDYVDSEGRQGTFQLQHRVYGKAGEPCPACGTAIRRIVVAQRGTHYCPKCQRP